MIFHLRSNLAIAAAAVASLIICGGWQLAPVVASEPAGVAEQATPAALPARRKTLIQSSRKAVARTGEAIVGVTKAAGMFVGWIVFKTIDGFFGDDDDTSDPVRARRDQELNDWIDSRDKWLREEKSR